MSRSEPGAPVPNADGVPAADAVRATHADVEAWRTELSNWGRWGPDDRLGTLNLIDDARRAAAVRLVRTGRAVSCSRPLPTRPAIDNPFPVTHTIVQTRDPNSAQDHLGIASHGFSTTHLDALCHVSHGGLSYNGVPAAPRGALLETTLGMGEMRDGVIGRGILLDVAGTDAQGGPGYLEAGTAVAPEALDAAAELAGIRVEAGDLVLVRTGRWALRDAAGAWSPTRRLAGLDARCLPWLHRHDVALLGSDGVSDAIPSPVEGEPEPIHDLAIVTLGLPLLDNLDLERLAVACRDLGRWEFLLVVAPLIVANGTGSPANPIALF
ncbi:MAG: hypothetical protein QOH61_1830 [Chloroflexota bacterium]|nr:hypothetical protein [Chloroflexota bacterium]